MADAATRPARRPAPMHAQLRKGARSPERSVSRVLCMATIPLGPSLPAGSSNQPGVIARATRLLSGLASGGVYRALSVTGEAVRSYRTISPLPTLRWAVCFLLHCPASHLDWPLTSTLPCEARTFLSRRHLRTATSGHLNLSVERAAHTYRPLGAVSNSSGRGGRLPGSARPQQGEATVRRFRHRRCHAAVREQLHNGRCRTHLSCRARLPCGDPLEVAPSC